MEALLASKGRPAYTWALSRATPHNLGRYTVEAFARASELIGAVEGVTVGNLG